ncbi:hypothetical protein RUM44_006738 [Polyplax serrata]|uniref:Uncharacterized protein n=1 Tax=Polyplax serrata TaxID=468196 RepID=A0ABR1AKH1_POLSC
MTSSEVKSSSGNPTYTIPKKMSSETVTRKASFKCSTPNRAASQRISRKVVLPLSTVQALTFKFNELSQMGEGQVKHRLSQTAVKTFLGSGGKSNTIKVVICRKPSTSKHKRTPDDLIVRRKINVRRYQTDNPNGVIKEEENVSPSVHKKITEFEGKEKGETTTLNGNKSRTGKIQVPKFLVDIDLNSENSRDVKTDKNNYIKKENSVSVRTAISMFEQNMKNSATSEKNLTVRGKPSNTSKVVNENGVDKASEFKAKPIAAIKPILKKAAEDKNLRKTKLLPKDSLNRKRYLQMKRELAKTGRSEENSDEESHSGSEKGNRAVSKAESKESNLEDVPDDSKSKGSDNTLRNNSSLHKQIQQFSVIANDIPLNDDKSQGKVEPFNGNQNLKPNTSFLWSKKEDLYGEKKPINRLDLPLPIPPENFIPNVIDKTEDTIYDDVIPTAVESDCEEFEKLEESDCGETYDDVGVYRSNKQKGLSSNNKEEKQFVENKNYLNKMSEALYDNPEKCSPYLYDDGEGEKYQYISERGNVVIPVSKGNDFELYQYIQNNKDESNIYEDIQSIKSHLTTKDSRVKDIYEDVNCTRSSGADYANNCYESVYNGIYSGNNNGPQGYIKSDQSDTSNNSGRSTYEKSNSLYGMSGENAAGNQHLLGE